MSNPITQPESVKRLHPEDAANDRWFSSFWCIYAVAVVVVAAAIGFYSCAGGAA